MPVHVHTYVMCGCGVVRGCMCVYTCGWVCIVVCVDTSMDMCVCLLLILSIFCGPNYSLYTWIQYFCLLHDVMTPFNTVQYPMCPLLSIVCDVLHVLSLSLQKEMTGKICR